MTGESASFTISLIFILSIHVDIVVRFVRDVFVENYDPTIEGDHPFMWNLKPMFKLYDRRVPENDNSRWPA